MSLTRFLEHGQPGWQEENPTTSYFDFVVAERPKYVPNSGPPSTPISVMPAHDNDGIILEKIAPYGAPFFYLVGYEATPQLRVGVKPQNILDWVSPRTFEAFELEQSRLRFAVKSQSTNIKAQKQKGRNISYSKPSQSAKPIARVQRKHRVFDDQTPRSKYVRSVPRPLSAPLAGPTRRRRRPDQDQIVFASPTTSQKSKGPSLVTPVKGLRVANIMDSDMINQDLYDTDAAIAGQLDGTSRHPNSWNQSLQPKANTPTVSQTLHGTPKPPAQPGSSVSRHKAITSFQSSSTRNRIERGVTSSPSKVASAPTSGRKALGIFEDLEHKFKPSQSEHDNKSNSRTISQRYSNFQPGPTMFSKSDIRAHFKTGTISSGAGLGLDDEEGEDLENETDDDEWELDEILDDAVVEGKQFYLIKWVGDWDNTWEPVNNVSKEAAMEYEKEKESIAEMLFSGDHEDAHDHRKNSSANEGTMGGQATSGSSDDHILRSGNQPHRGANLHQQSKEDALFVTDNWSQGVPGQENPRKPDWKPPGEVVDDDDATSGGTDYMDAIQ